ncbi:MAG: SIS domain-containing protein, partial [Candidatus Omnitrophica bacterium]|nr:SIS domain-containing protein [Candidatus Omnitrophota bacterium]
MKILISERIEESIRVKESVLWKEVRNIEKAAKLMIASLRRGGKIIVFGNGGSAADSQHIVAELVGRFLKERKALAAVALTTNTSTLTALANDYGYDVVFSRQVEALGKKGDVALGISTSGNSPNVIAAIKKARAMGLATVGLSGGNGGALKKASRVCIT